MRRTIVVALAVLALACALCGAGTHLVHRAATEADTLYRQAERAARLGDTNGAMEAVDALEAKWRQRRPALELLTGHDALSDVQASIADARVCLENNQRVEFLRACAAAREALEYLMATESLHVLNLF